MYKFTISMDCVEWFNNLISNTQTVEIDTIEDATMLQWILEKLEVESKQWHLQLEMLKVLNLLPKIEKIFIYNMFYKKNWSFSTFCDKLTTIISNWENDDAEWFFFLHMPEAPNWSNTETLRKMSNFDVFVKLTSLSEMLETELDKKINWDKEKLIFPESKFVKIWWKIYLNTVLTNILDNDIDKYEAKNMWDDNISTIEIWWKNFNKNVLKIKTGKLV